MLLSFIICFKYNNNCKNHDIKSIRYNNNCVGNVALSFTKKQNVCSLFSNVLHYAITCIHLFALWLIKINEIFTNLAVQVHTDGFRLKRRHFFNQFYEKTVPSYNDGDDDDERESIERSNFDATPSCSEAMQIKAPSPYCYRSRFKGLQSYLRRLQHIYKSLNFISSKLKLHSQSVRPFSP